MKRQKSATSAIREELALSGAEVADKDNIQRRAINRLAKADQSTASKELKANHGNDLTVLKQKLLERQKGNALAMVSAFSDASVEAANYLLRVVRGDYGEDVNHRTRIEAAKTVLHHFGPEQAVKLAGLDALQGKDLSSMTPAELQQFIELGRSAVDQLRQTQGTVATYEAIPANTIKDLE